jgi:ABC-type uncharacterized transport system involved in gliding motility auxiliary subunit
VIHRRTLGAAVMSLAVMAFSLWSAFALSRFEALRFDISRSSIAALSPATIEALKNLSQPVSLTYYVSDQKQLPTEHNHLRREVSALLKEMRRQSNGLLDFSVVDPTTDSETIAALVRRRISSFNVKRIARDEMEVNHIWSAMLVTADEEQRAIPYILSEHLANLENRIISLIQDIETKRPPELAISAPGEYRALALQAANHGMVNTFDFKSQPLPASSDMAILVQPQLTAEKAADIRAFLEDGKNVFIFFSAAKLAPTFDQQGYVTSVKLAGEDLNLDLLLKDMGIRTPPSLVMSEERFGQEPYMLRLRSSWIDFTRFRLKRTGVLLMPLASPLEVDPDVLSRADMKAEVLIRTSEKSWVLPASERTWKAQDFLTVPTGAGRQQILNAGLMLHSSKPWHGRLVLYSSRHIFSDQVLASNPGNATYLRNFFMTFMTPANMTSLKVDRQPKPIIKEILMGAKISWRIFTVLLAPFVLLVLMSYKLFAHRSHAPQAPMLSRWITVGAASLPLGVLLLLAFWPQGRAVFDLTRGRLNTPAPETAALLQKLPAPAHIRYVESLSGQTAREGRLMAQSVEDALNRIRDASQGKVSFSVEKLDSRIWDEPSVLDSLRREGIKPFTFKVIEQDTYLERQAISGIVIKGGDKTEVISPLQALTQDKLEFLLAWGLRRVAFNEKPPRVAFMSEYHPVTPAEAHMEYSQQQLAVPEAADPYSRLRELTAEYGYQVIHAYPRSPTPIDADLFVYIQPTRVNDHVKNEFHRHLAAGKNAIVAAQYFVNEQRQYSGRGLAPVYWPAPQFPRVNELLKPYGIELKREILMDQTKSDRAVEGQIRWGAYLKEKVTQSVALPFFIRAIASQFDAASPITAFLSDLLFISGNRWIMGKEGLLSTLTWTPLVTTSQRAWAYEWSGGMVREEQLQPTEWFSEPQPLAVLISGAFKAAARPAQMLLIGCSEMFKNAHLMDRQFAHKNFMMNAIVALTHGEEMTRLHSRGDRRHVSFGFVPAQTKAVFRATGVFLVPVLFLMVGLYRRAKMVWGPLAVR